MTIAISLKVHDGLVLAADSASTLFGKDASGRPGVVNVYSTANKVFNLYKGLPIGCIIWGAGSIGHASVSTLVKDLRRQLMGRDPKHQDWNVSTDNYSVEDVASQTRRFFFDELYVPAFKDVEDDQKPALGLLVAGYSAGEDLPEEWRIDIKKGVCPNAQLVRAKDVCGISWNGEPEAITRLVLGHGTKLPEVLRGSGVPEEQIDPFMEQVEQHLKVSLVQAPMPIQDAIDLARFLVDATVMFSRFAPGAPTVGGPVEIAAITKHEGFKWVQRKFYYEARYNPKEDQ